MRKAAQFYANKVATQGGYHFYYADDLSYGRSEHGEGPTQIELQREGTPLAGMAFLEAFDATGERLYLDAARAAAMATVKGQLCSGGFDYVVEFDPVKRKQYGYRSDTGCTTPSKPPTTLDDNVTQSAIRLLMRVDRALEFKDKQIHEAAMFALDALMKAQFSNGAWPQRYSTFPDPKEHQPRKASYPESWPRKWPGGKYYGHYTFNDGTIIDAIDTMLEAARIYKDERYRVAAERGGDFILLAQMPEPQPAWAQQYDADMHPAWARLFEPPSVTGGESQGILRLLMVLYRETGKRRYLDAVPKALGYLERSVLPRTDNPSEIRRRTGEPALARFYELQTNRPLYITKGTQIDAKGLGSARIDGYEVTYDDASVITHYAVLVSGSGLPALRNEYEAVAASPKQRPAVLHGLSPWSEAQETQRPSVEKVRAIIDSLDGRGAWTQDGVIGRPDRVVEVFAAREMMLMVNGKPFPIHENDRISLYQGPQPPRTKVIRTTTFAANLRALAAFVKD